MKKKIFIISIICVLLFFGYLIVKKVYNKVLISKANNELSDLFEPYIENVKIDFEGDTYYLRINDARVTDHRDLNKFGIRDTSVTFSIYKNEVSEEQLYGSARIFMYAEVDENDVYYINLHQDSTTYFDYIFQRFTHLYADKLCETNYDKSESYVMDGTGRANEVGLEYNSYGEVITPSDVYYNAKIVTNKFTLKFTGTAYIVDFDKENILRVVLE